MPRLSAWFIRFALAYLFLGFTFGGLLLVHKGLNIMPWTWMLLPPHIEFLLLGWTFQLAAGVAYWILPRLGTDRPRGNPALAWLAFFLFNAGIVLVSVQSFVNWSGLHLLGRLAELGGSLLFLLAVWKRVKPFQK